MPPHVEQIATMEYSFSKPEYFAVGLVDQKPFDAELFDAQLKRICDSSNIPLGKYIVVDDVMYICGDHFRHTSFRQALGTQGVSGEVQSAGSIAGNYSGDDDYGPTRQIFGYAPSLERDDILSKDRSDAYRDTVISERLGEHIGVTDERIYKNRL